MGILKMPLKSNAVFDAMKAGLPQHGAKIVAAVQCVYLFEIREKKGAKPVYFTVNLKDGSGSVTEGKVEGVKADSTFVMLDDDFAKMAAGKLKPQEAFMQGKMKTKGNLKAAMKFKADMIPKDAKL